MLFIISDVKLILNISSSLIVWDEVAPSYHFCFCKMIHDWCIVCQLQVISLVFWFVWFLYIYSHVYLSMKSIINSDDCKCILPIVVVITLWSWRKGTLCDSMRTGRVSNKCSLTVGSDMWTSWTGSCLLHNPAPGSAGVCLCTTHFAMSSFIFTPLRHWQQWLIFQVWVHLDSQMNWLSFGGQLMSVPFLSMQYLRNIWRELCYIWHKHPLGLMDKLMNMSLHRHAC